MCSLLKHFCFNRKKVIMGAKGSKNVDMEDPLSFSREALKAAILIQKWFRRYRERQDARRECVWKVFETLEYSSEQSQIRLNTFFNEMLDHVSTRGTVDHMDLPLLLSPCKTTMSEDNFCQSLADNQEKPDDSYKGPSLTFPITPRQVHDMVKHFKDKTTIHGKYLCELLVHVRKKLKTYGNVRHASTACAARITVCGDLHGNLDDLLIIFYKNGVPAANNPYVFNGDIVDRGTQSIEVCIVLFCYFLMYPNEMFLNRGNHEDRLMNMRYGFIEEITTKYPRSQQSKCIIKLFEQVFSWLPVATVIDNKVLCLHGGISDSTDLEFLSSIDRHKYSSILKPGYVSNTADNQKTAVQETAFQAREREQICELLWSDPCEENGCYPNTYRGGGCYFGPDVVRRVLGQYKYELLIRSHECKMEGYEYSHDGLTLTLFSASNYYGPGTNRGAYLKLTGIALDRQFVQYMSLRGQPKRKMTPAQRIADMETAAVKSLWEKIASVKTELVTEFKKYDTKGTGTIKPCQWFICMQQVTGMQVQWNSLLPKMAVCDSSGNVIYATTFEQYSVQPELQQSAVEVKVMENMYKHKDNLETIFRLLDRDNSGKITMEEFEEAFMILSQHIHFTLNAEEIRELAQSMDMNKDGYIEFGEFLHTFRIVDMKAKEPAPANGVYPESPGKLSSFIQTGSPRKKKGRKKSKVDLEDLKMDAKVCEIEAEDVITVSKETRC